MSNPLNLSSTTPSTGGLFGSSGSGFKLGASNSSFNLGNTSTTGGAGSGFSFNLGGSSTTPANQPASQTTATTTSGTGLGLGLGLNAPNSTLPSSSTSTLGTSTTPATGLTLGGGLGSTTTASNPSLTSTLSSSTTPALGLGSTLSKPATTQLAATSSSSNPITFKVLEDYINKWMSDLETHEKDFLNQATQLNALDKLMIENGEKIIDVSSEVNRLNTEQDQLEQELNFVFSQQNDLEQAIKKLESSIEQMPLITQQTSDTSRIEMYKLLIEVDNQLKTMSIDLKDIIKRLNETNVNINDPVVQISKILNAHMDSLNWIEENALSVQNQVENLSKGLEDRLRETDSSSRFLYLS